MALRLTLLHGSSVCSSFSAKACATCWPLQHQLVPFLFSSSHTLALSSPPCPLLDLSFSLNLSGRSGRNYLLSPPVLSGYNGPLHTRFSRKTMQLMSWPDGERFSCLLQSLVVSLSSYFLYPLFSFLELEAYCLIEIVPHTVSLDFTVKLVLPRHARCVISRLRCNGHSLLLNTYLTRIGRIENPSCNACAYLSQVTSNHSALSSYRLFAPFALWRFSVSLRTLVQALRSCPAFGVPWSLAIPHPLEGER